MGCARRMDLLCQHSGVQAWIDGLSMPGQPAGPARCPGAGQAGSRAVWHLTVLGWLWLQAPLYNAQVFPPAIPQDNTPPHLHMLCINRASPYLLAPLTWLRQNVTGQYRAVRPRFKKYCIHSIPSSAVLLSGVLAKQSVCASPRPPLPPRRARAHNSPALEPVQCAATELPSQQNHNSFNLISLQ